MWPTVVSVSKNVWYVLVVSLVSILPIESLLESSLQEATTPDTIIVSVICCETDSPTTKFLKVLVSANVRVVIAPVAKSKSVSSSDKLVSKSSPEYSNKSQLSLNVWSLPNW